MADDPIAPKSPAHLRDLSGQTVGEFYLLRKLGQGGMGQVYLARQTSLKRDVAVKILREDYAENPTALRRFQAEAEAVASISHQNIVQVYAIGEQDGLNFMALEYLEGRNLREFLERKGPPELSIALLILKQVAAALQRASELGLVHRDIKPENILLNRKVEVKVTDFGLSRYFAGDAPPLSLTQSGVTLGTPLYMSPEQVQGKPVDHRSDLYSLGVTAYHLLAGQPPFRGATAFDVAVQHVQAEPESLAVHRPELPDELVAIVHKLLAKNPDDRFANAKEVIRELGRVTRPSTEARNASLMVPPVDVSLGVATLPALLVPQAKPKHSLRLGRVMGLVLASSLAGVVGWGLAATLNPARDAITPVTQLGLPLQVSPVPVVSVREATLKQRWQNTNLQIRDQIKAGLDLALLQLAEHRLAEAEAVFHEMEANPSKANLNDPARALPLSASAIGKIGLAIVLAHQDQPKNSNQLLEQVLLGLPRAQVRAAMEKLCFDFAEFGRAISEAVNRNADNLPRDAKLNPIVEWLRTPSALLRGPK